MPETERLGCSRGVMEQLRASHEQLSREELLDLVCHLTKTYVLDRTLPFALPHPEREQEMRHDRPDAPQTRAEETDEANDAPEAPEARFARLIENLKARTGLPQLSGFHVEGDRAVLVVDNQKITFGERVTVEFMPRRKAPTTPSPGSPAEPSPRRSPGAPEPRTEPARPHQEPKSVSPKPPTPSTDDEDDDGYDPSVERFKRLDLD